MQTVYGTQDVAKMMGISKQTLLRYEKRKIIPKARRNLINRRREYSVADIEKLKTILGRI